MMDVYWLEQSEADVPLENDWLSARELACLNSLRFPKRRADWRLGRWTAKRALAAYCDVPSHSQSLVKIEIHPAPSGAPEVFFFSQPAPVTISLSHSAGTAMCAIARSSVSLGCDLEAIEPRARAFVTDYFVDEEQALIARLRADDRPQLVTLLWSAKESTLKALAVGLRLDTRCVTVSPDDALAGRFGDQKRYNDNPALAFRNYGFDGWRSLQACHAGAQVFRGWWLRDGNRLRTVVADPPPAPPILLEIEPQIRLRRMSAGIQSRQGSAQA
jgi:4'-phosphopantetheinyl transferase